jgi:hypothetical protein
MAPPIGIKVGAGINIGAGISLGAEAAPITGGTITYLEMNPPVVAGFQLQDGTATVNGSVGFTINNGANTGVAVQTLTIENQTFFNNQGTGFYAASFGAGSTYANSTVQITQTPSMGGGTMVFFFDPGLTYPATFNYPFTIA